MSQLAPVAQVNRVGCYIVAGGSAEDDAGNVSTNLIAADEDWSDVLGKPVVTVPIADGVRAFHIRMPHGTWLNAAGNEWLVRCNPNGQPIRVPALYAAKLWAIARGATRLTDGWGTFLAGLNGQGCATCSYNEVPPNYAHPGPGVLENWQEDPLTQTGYTTLAEILNLGYSESLFSEELQNGCTEFGWDESGGSPEDYVFMSVIAGLLTGTGAQTVAGFSGTFTNEHPRTVTLEANPVRATTAWAAPYSFTAQRSTFEARIGDDKYLQPDEMGTLPRVIIRGITEDDYQHALRLAASYRVDVKWQPMKANVGDTKMQALLARGLTTPTDGGGGSGGIGGSVAVPAGAVRGRIRTRRRDGVVSLALGK